MRRSAIESYMTCPQQYQYRWVEGLVPPQMALAPFVGVVFRTAMQRWLQTPVVDRSESWLIECLKSALAQHEAEVEPDRWQEAKELLKPMIRAYYQKFGNDPTVYGATEIPVSKGSLTATIDGSIELGDGRWMIEHKTGDPDEEMLMLNNFQVDLYHVLATHSGLDHKGTAFTIVERPRSADQKKLPAVHRYWMEKSANALADALRTAETVQTAIDLGIVYRHRGIHCSWCDYRWLCRMHLLGGDEQALKEQMFMKEPQ